MSSEHSDELYAKALTIAHHALELPTVQQASYLNAHCRDDAALRQEVESLIAACTDSSLDEIPPAITLADNELAATLRIEATAPARYHLIERLGEGGMGVVWLAEREVNHVRQRVALKRLRLGAMAQQARFQAEQRILAALSHPNIAHLIDAGSDADGEPFLAMEYVEGERIDRWSETHALDLRARIGLFLKVCAAVSYAHGRLVIHRDLKPDNILVDASGEPKLLDFGIARLLNADATATLTMHAMTLAYASPEQIEGATLGTASDVYSLGVVLYELVAGVRPFEDLATEHARSSAVLVGHITPPSQQRPRDGAKVGEVKRQRRLPADIDAILLKALRREPSQRYASVREFAQDLERYLAARPVHARRGQSTYRAQRYLQRNRWPISIAASLAIVVAGFTWRTVLAEREARVQAHLANRTTKFLISAFALSDPTQIEQQAFSARDVLDRGRERVDEELADQPRVRARLLEALGNAYLGINEGSAGAPLLEKAAQLNLSPEVNDPLAAARNLRAKAISLFTAHGATDQAEQTAQAALDLIQRHDGNNAVALGEAYGTLASALDASEKNDLALQAAQQALALHEAADGNALGVANSVSDLCAITSSTGEYAQALPHCERALLLYAQAGATRSNDYRRTLLSFAVTLLYGGDSERGLALLRERTALTRELYGDDSNALAMDRIRLAEKFAEYGHFDEAAVELAASMPVILQRNGARSTQYAFAVFHAGWLRYALGEFDTAVLMLRQALEIHDAVVAGRGGGRLHVFRVTLATALIEAGHADAEARRLLETVIAARSETQQDSVNLPYAQLPLARWFVSHGDYAAAEALLDRVDAAGTRVEKELHARAAATRADVLRGYGDPAGAVRMDQSAYDITREDRGATHPRTARYALRYAAALRSIGEIAKARRLEREYRPLIAQAYPATSAFHRALSGPAGRTTP